MIQVSGRDAPSHPLEESGSLAAIKRLRCFFICCLNE